MADLSTKYLGLELRSPIVMGACGLTSEADGVRRAEEAGAGAVVLKSLFEEQIRIETEEARAALEAAGHSEAIGYLESELFVRYGPRDYCALVESCKKAVSVPVIASVNCAGRRWWTDFARDLESAGADAIELNVLVPGTDPATTGSEVEKTTVDVVKAVASAVRVPVAAKVGPSFSSFANVAQGLARAGARGLVLFNRFYTPDVDVETLELGGASPLSEPVESRLVLRWVGLLAGRVPCDLAASTGLHDADQVIKQLLCGATVVQVVSTVYRNGFERIATLGAGLEGWMERHGFLRLDDFRGSLSFARTGSGAHYEREQYIKGLSSLE